MTDLHTTSADVCILGAGPHGLAAAVFLHRAAPDLKVVTLDPAGQWLAGWHEQFARLKIDTLRSPMVHHPCPDPVAMGRFVNRYELSRSGLPYDIPTAESFRAFCDGLVADAQLPAPLPWRPRQVERNDKKLVLEGPEGRVEADHVIVATNPHHRSIPEWSWPILGQRPKLVEFGLDVDLREHADRTGEHIAIIGGGLTAAHLACGAAAAGAVAHLISREEVRVRDFDTDPGWLGPKYLRDFYAESDPSRRLHMSRVARSGGSIPRWMIARLDELAADGRFVRHDATTVRAADLVEDGARLALSSHEVLVAQRVWLATGTTPDLTALRCLEPLLADVPTIEGLPIVDDTLRLGPHPIHAMGRLTTIALGPAAGNLWGAQRAARRITAAITGIDLDLNTVVETRATPG